MKLARRYKVEHSAGAYVSIFESEIENLGEDQIMAMVQEKATHAMMILGIERLWIPDDNLTVVVKANFTNKEGPTDA